MYRRPIYVLSSIGGGLAPDIEDSLELLGG